MKGTLVDSYGMNEMVTVKSGAEINALPPGTTMVKGDGLTDADLAGLIRLPALSTLYLEGCLDLTDAALECLGRLPALKELYLSSRHITDEGLQHLARARELTELGLDLLCTGEGFAYLVDLPELEEIHLPTWPNLDPRHLGVLSTLRKLGRIYTYKCAAMTPQAVADLMDALPQVEIEVR